MECARTGWESGDRLRSYSKANTGNYVVFLSEGAVYRISDAKQLQVLGPLSGAAAAPDELPVSSDAKSGALPISVRGASADSLRGASADSLRGASDEEEAWGQRLGVGGHGARPSSRPEVAVWQALHACPLARVENPVNSHPVQASKVQTGRVWRMFNRAIAHRGLVDVGNDDAVLPISWCRAAPRSDLKGCHCLSLCLCAGGVPNRCFAIVEKCRGCPLQEGAPNGDAVVRVQGGRRRHTADELRTRLAASAGEEWPARLQGLLYPNSVPFVR